MTLMQVNPAVRRGMLIISLVMMAAGVRSVFRRPGSPAIRIMTAAFSALTTVVVVWSLIRFGL
ncbi:MAG TPA: hypothetical protein VI007_05250 [bacterium]